MPDPTDPAEGRRRWLARLDALMAELHPGVATHPLGEADRLGEDAGLDSLQFERLFARLKVEVGAPIDALAWFDALDVGGGRVSVLLDLLVAAAPGGPAPPAAVDLAGHA